MFSAVVIACALAAHPTFTVRGSVGLAENRLQISLEDSALRLMHLDDAPGEGVTLSNWLASSLDVRDRSGREIGLEVCQDSNVVRVCSASGDGSFPVTISYTPASSPSIHPPARLVLAGETQVDAAAALVPGRGPSVIGRPAGESELGARVTRSAAGQIGVSVCLPVSVLPSAAFSGGAIEGVALDEPAARSVESYVSRALSGVIAPESGPAQVELFVPGADIGGAFPVNVHLAWVRAKLWVRSDRADIELPLRDLGLLSLPVTVVDRHTQPTRGLATLRDPRVRVGPDGTSVGREF